MAIYTRPQNALVGLINPQLQQTQTPVHPALQNMIAGLIGSDAMSAPDRAAYYQATGERISGGGEPAAPQVTSYQAESTRTVDPARVRAYLAQRQAEIEAYRAQQAAQAAAPKRTYYGD